MEDVTMRYSVDDYQGLNVDLQTRYEPYRLAKVDELTMIAHRRAIAAVDWVECISEIADFNDTDDKV